MLTNTRMTSVMELPLPTEKPYLLFLLCMVWIVMGLVGHAPWKPDELQHAAIIQAWLQNGDWLIPRLGGEPYGYYPPLYLYLTALLAKLFSPWLFSVHDAARLCTGLFMTGTLTVMGLTGRELLGRSHGRVVVLLLIGCVGLVLRGHQLNSLTASLFGFALCIYGWQRALRAVRGSIRWVVLGIILTAYTAGWLEALLLLLPTLMLPALPCWKGHGRIWWALLPAGLALVIPPIYLAVQHPEAWAVWKHSLGVIRLTQWGKVAYVRETQYFASLLMWFAWPVLPLALIAFWKRRNNWRQDVVLQLSTACFGLWFLLLIWSPEASDANALPLLLPLALLAASEVDRLQRGFVAALNWFGMMSFGLFALAVWVVYFALLTEQPYHIYVWAMQISPSYQARFSLLNALLAVVLSAVWVWAILRKRRIGRQAVTNWACGLTLLWSLLMLLLLPWVDAGKSYAPMVQSMQPWLQGVNCVQTLEVGASQRAALAYYAHVAMVSTPSQPTHCTRQLQPTTQAAPTGNWYPVWQGARAGDMRENFTLWQLDRAK